MIPSVDIRKVGTLCLTSTYRFEVAALLNFLNVGETKLNFSVLNSLSEAVQVDIPCIGKLQHTPLLLGHTEYLIMTKSGLGYKWYSTLILHINTVCTYILLCFCPTLNCFHSF